MKNLSLFDRKFLLLCKITAEPRRFTDDIFLRACGVAPLRYYTSDGISRLLSIFVMDGLWPEGMPYEREAELRRAVFAKSPQGRHETNIENLLSEFEKQVVREVQAILPRR